MADKLGSGFGNEAGLPPQKIPQAAVALATGGAGQQDPNDPSLTSGDYEAQKPYWDLVDTLQGGVEAMRKAGEKWLPRFEKETTSQYGDRLKVSRFTNIFDDIVSDLAARPFAEECTLEEGADARFVALAADVDGCGSSLHVFAANTFYDGVRRAIDWILVDFTKATPVDGRPLSQAEEAAQGLRPFWVKIPAPAMIRVRSAFVGGEEVFYHAAFREDSVEPNGFAEVLKNRIRVYTREPILAGPRIVGFEPAVWTLYEEQVDFISGRKIWAVIDQGDVTIGIIPLVPFATGRRCGRSWRFEPPLKGCADLQIEHYQAENGVKWQGVMTAYSMLSGNGVTPKVDKAGKPEPLDIGPRSVLYAPPGGEGRSLPSWTIIEPAGATLTFNSGEVDKIERRLRELGRQPLTADAANLTVVTTLFAAQKGNSAVQAWAHVLNFALERAWKITALWLNAPDQAPKVKVHTDFSIELDDKGPDVLTTARGAGDLTLETYWDELKRRNILKPDFDPKKEKAALDQEKADNIASQADMLAAAGMNPKPSTPGAPPAKPAIPAPAKPPAKTTTH